MTIEEFQQKIRDILNDYRALDVYVSSDFQCEQTSGFPILLCVCRKLEKVWLLPNEFMQVCGEDIS